MSEVKVNKISPRANCGTVQLGDSGDTITIPAGATITNNGTAAGFGSTGEISWDTTPKTGDFTGVSGVGYFIDTTSGAVAVTLPGSPSAGNVIGVADYNSTAATNAITINRNSNKINGGTENLVIGKANSAIQLIYIDATTGWQSVFTGNTGDITKQYLVATGGTVTEDGSFKVHRFTGPGTFQVTTEAENTSDNVVDYLVVAGGGAGGMNNGGFNGGGGGGAGGTRFSATTYCSSSPLKAPAALPVSAQSYPITVGAGGVGSNGPGPSKGAPGNNSIFSTITSALGGGGGSGTAPGTIRNGEDGGSGGGGAGVNGSGGGTAGSGNTPSVSPAQGSAGGAGNCGSDHQGGGGGGFTACGQAGSAGGDGGAGLAIDITGSPVAYGGGGGGSRGAPSSAPAVPQGGLGGGGNGSDNPIPGGVPSGSPGGSGTANTGGGGGGSNANQNGGSGGSGVVVIRYKFKD